MADDELLSSITPSDDSWMDESAAQLMSPEELAAQRTRRAVRPAGGRKESLFTKIPAAVGGVIKKYAGDMITLPQRSFEAADEYSRTGQLDDNAVTTMLEAALTPAIRAPFTKAGEAGIYGTKLIFPDKEVLFKRAEDMINSGVPMDRVLRETGIDRDVYGNLVKEIGGQQMQFKFDPTKKQAVGDRAEKVIDFPELYDRVPVTKEARITTNINPKGPDMEGSYYVMQELAPGQWTTPEIDMIARTPELLRQGIGHEFTHIAQQKMGLPYGGNPESARYPAIVKDISDWGQKQLDISAKHLREYAMRKMAQGVTKDIHKYWQRDFPRQAMLLERSGVMSKLKNPLQLYTHLAAEVDARNTQARMNLHPDILTRHPRTQTQHIPDYQQILDDVVRPGMYELEKDLR